MVQLMMEDDTKEYRVILVSRRSTSSFPQAFSAHCYSSQTGGWNTLDSGLVYGAEALPKAGYAGHFVPYVFDCTTKALSSLPECEYIQFLEVFAYSMFKDHLFVLHVDDNDEVVISELIWESSVSDLRVVNVFDSDLHDVRDLRSRGRDMLFASCGFVLLITDYTANWREDRRQRMEFHELSTKDSHVPLALDKGNPFQGEEFGRLAMSELRWDISP